MKPGHTNSTPARTCHEAAAYKLNWEDLALLHDRHVWVGHAQYRVGDNVGGVLEPPGACLVQHLHRRSTNKTSVER